VALEKESDIINSS